MRVTCPECSHEFDIAPRRRPGHSRLVHKAIAHVASELGMDPAILKIELKLRTGEWEPFPFVNDDPPEWPGKFVASDDCYEITGWPAVFLKSESAYTKREETLLKNVTVAYAEANHVSMDWMRDEE